MFVLKTFFKESCKKKIQGPGFVHFDFEDYKPCYLGRPDKNLTFNLDKMAPKGVVRFIWTFNKKQYFAID